MAEVTYNYMGTRTRLGKAEALLTLEGRLHGQKGEEGKVGGKMRGDAGVDLQTGQIVFANATVDMDFDLGKSKKKASGTLTVKLYQLVFKDPVKK